MFGKKKLYFVLDNTGKTLYTVTDSKQIAIDTMKNYSNPYIKPIHYNLLRCS